MLFSLIRQSILLSESDKLLQTQLRLKEKEDQYHYLKHYDTLTDLPNLEQTKIFIDATIKKLAPNNQTFSIFYLDIDRFKLINDSLGNQVGDMLLVAVAERLRSHFPDDFIARLSGDKFLLFIEQENDQEQAAQSAKAIIDTITPPYQLDEVELTIDVSIGISMYPKDNHSATELIRDADAAVHNAKRFGGSIYLFYTADLIQKSEHQLALDNSLRAAIKNHHFQLDYQPVYTLNAEGETYIMGAEALIRWRNNGVLVPPLEFIAHAEATGFILKIGNWVIDQAFKQLAQWNETLPKQLVMAINLSPRQFYDKDLVANISNSIAQYRLNPKMIKLEITESALFDQEDLAISILTDLRALGVQISLDDFGTGHSSLSQLKKIPLDEIKLDRSFLQGVPQNTFENKIVLSIINMAKALDIDMVCEGIETQEQLNFLKKTDCKMYQGYLLSRPISADALSALMLNQHVT